MTCQRALQLRNLLRRRRTWAFGEVIVFMLVCTAMGALATLLYYAL